MSGNHTCGCGHSDDTADKETEKCGCGGSCGCTPSAETVKQIAQEQADD